MDQVREGVQEMEAVERKLLQVRSGRAQDDVRTTILIVILGSALVMALAGAAIVIVHRDFQKRRLAEEDSLQLAPS